MTRTKNTYLALLAVLLSPMAANADPIDIQFSFDEDGVADFGGTPVAGTVTGTILGLMDDTANQIAGISVIIDSFPAGLGGVFDNGLDTSLWDIIVGAGFSVFGGEVTAADYAAQMGASGSPFDQIRLNYFGYNLLTADGGATITGNSDGFGGTIYSSVPEPGTLALLGIGLFGMGLARRKKV